MKKLRFLTALYFSKMIAILIKIIAPDKGSNLPGEYALKIDPQFIRHIKNLDMDKVICITGTNGKSTTTNLVAHIFKNAGISVAANLAGANMLPGVATTMINNTSLTGKLNKDLVLLETDERFLPIIRRELPAKNLCILNVFKDQVHRNGEPDIIWRKIDSAIDEDMTLFVNANEPNACAFNKKVKNYISFGVDRNSASYEKKDDFFAITMPCPICHDNIEFDYYNIESVGKFHCPHCGFGNERPVDYLAKNIDFENKTFEYDGKEYTFGYSTPYFLYCYIAAIAITKAFGVSEDVIDASMKSFVNIGGRMEALHIGHQDMRYMRIKQEGPETLQSALNVARADKNEKDFALGLFEVTDTKPHYVPTFYTYDCDFRGLIASDLNRCVCFSKTTANDAALRILYDGFNEENMEIIATDNFDAVLDEVKNSECDNVYFITWLQEYEKMKKLANSNNEDKEV